MTFGDLIDRIYREYLEIVDDQVASAATTQSLSDSGSTVVIADTLTPEEFGRLAVGVIVELDRELCHVVGFDASARELTLRRAVMGTTAVEHASGAWLRISPEFTRQSVFEALADVIDSFWPDLWGVATAECAPYVSGTWLLPDPDAVEVTTAWAYINGGWREVAASIRPALGDYVGGRPVAVSGSGSLSRLQVTYRKRITRPTAETDNLETLGFDLAWTQAAIYGAAASLLAGREFERETSDYLTQMLELAAPGTELGRRSNVSTTFLRLQDVLLRRHRRQLRAENETSVITMDPFA